MLVLTRRENEKVVIGDNITVEVLEIRGGRVKLGFHAPGDVNIVRGELTVAAQAPVCRQVAADRDAGRQPLPLLR